MYVYVGDGPILARLRVFAVSHASDSAAERMMYI